MKSAVIVSLFDNYSYNVRIKYIECYLKEKGYVCTVISADFDHRNKQKYSTVRENLTLLHVPEYKKNLSINRIYSHYIFAKLVYKKLNELKPNLIYGSTPPNFLFKYINRIKQENPKVKLLYEVGDLWPETLPISGKLKVIASPFLSIWASLRNKGIGKADAIIFECDLFKQKLESYCPNTLKKKIYLCKEDYFSGRAIKFVSSDKILKFAYIGSINNIIDINLIVSILEEVKREKPVLIKIIGSGEKKAKLLSLCKEKGIEYKDYGIIYDDQRKEKILADCNFGFNIMKNNVVVGATMKSLEYFHWGLALINNIPADTQKIVEQNCCGINIRQKSTKSVADYIIGLSTEQLLDMRICARKVYSQYFSEKVISEQFLEVLSFIEEK